ncbi:MAG: hypothetical protein J5608_00150 [Alphaproteobacteria bacterium]|nr:hypothetical protein [Alphaproteobacteria bacterium]
MKKQLIVCALCALTLPAFGAGRSMVGTAQPAARLGVLPVVHPGASLPGAASSAVVQNTTTGVSVVDDDPEPATNVNMREDEKKLCEGNNVGVGNTYVWASRLGGTANYASMVEDTEHPENNACFVLVGMKSDDNRINVSDIQPRYFVMGETITCGSWVDEEMLKQRILDAKKKGRVWATVGGAVGGAGIGVGAMELFGNKLIGGKVQGQKDLKGDQLLVSQLNVLKKDNPTEYKRVVDDLKVVKTECSKVPAGTDTPEGCKKYDYTMILSSLGE